MTMEEKENKWKVKHLARTQIWKIPERDDVIRMIKEGQSSEKIRKYMSEHGHKIGYHALRSFKETLMGNTTGYYRERIKEFDRIIDAVESHAYTINLLRERIEEMREREKEEFEDKDEELKHKTELRLSIQLLASLSHDHVIVKQQLGLLPLPLQKSASFSHNRFDSEYGKLMKGKIKIKTKKI